MAVSMNKPQPLWLTVAPIIFVILWSGGFTVAKIGLNYAEPMTLLAVRYVCVLILLLPLYFAVKPPLPVTLRQWGNLALVGFLMQVVYFGFSYLAFKTGASAASVAVIVCLQPILVGLIAPHFVGEKVRATRWLGLVLGLAGAAIVILSRDSFATQSLWGLAAVIAALLGITTGTLWEKRFGVAYHPITSNLVQYAVGALFTLPMAFATESMAITWSWQLTSSLAYLVIANSLISMTLLLAMIRAGEVSRVSSLFYLVPPLSALIAWGLIGEALPALAWAGMAIAAAGVAIASRNPKLSS